MHRFDTLASLACAEPHSTGVPASQWPRIPRISYDLVTSSELDKGVEDGGAFDYLGRVILAGRQERSRKVLEWGSGGVSPRGWCLYPPSTAFTILIHFY
jgi:hypothetical protein